MKNIVRLTVIFTIAFLATAFAAGERGSPDYWPTEGWQTSTPEEQGMDSNGLADLLDEIQRQDYHIRSVIVIRNGHLVLDACFHPYPTGTRHIIHSCTKSVTGSLIGIAIDGGHIQSVDQKVIDFFPDRTIENLDANKESMTIEHLLTMSSGLNCEDSYLYDWRGLGGMMRSMDWEGYVLDLPMEHEPGEHFEYCNGASYLLSVILQKSTQTTALAFAKQRLFGPLGITDVTWRMSRQGVNTGWGDMQMPPRDLAKIGYLFLNEGKWDDREIVSAEWIKRSTKPHIWAGTLSDSYGYQIWPNEAGYYMMLGFGGQYVIVHPEKDLITVFASCLESRDFFVPRILYHEFILPAVTSPTPQPANKKATERLHRLVEAIASQEPKPVPPLPGIAEKISGKRFVFDENPAGFQWVSFKFQPDSDEARMNLAVGPSAAQADVGLDDVYRVTHSGGQYQALKGRWEDDNTFEIEYEIVDQTRRGVARITFDADMLTMRYTEVIQGMEREFVARTIKKN